MLSFVVNHLLFIVVFPLSNWSYLSSSGANAEVSTPHHAARFSQHTTQVRHTPFKTTHCGDPALAPLRNAVTRNKRTLPEEVTAIELEDAAVSLNLEVVALWTLNFSFEIWKASLFNSCLSREQELCWNLCSARVAQSPCNNASLGCVPHSTVLGELHIWCALEELDWAWSQGSSKGRPHLGIPSQSLR